MWLDRLPKAELHCHLDGSVPLPVLRKLCVKGHVEVPGDEKAFRKLAEAGEECESLTEYLKAFELPLSCLKTEEAFYTAAFETAASAAEEGVRYLELRFAPLLSESESLTAESIIEASAAGLEKAFREKGIYASLILCGMRHFPEKDNFRTLELGKKYLGRGVCGADLAGDESAYFNEQFLEYFKRAGKYEIPFTVHSGECGRIENIALAVDHGAKRIGHGIAMSGDRKLQEKLRGRGIGVELCPHSNIQTGACLKIHPSNPQLHSGAVRAVEKYPFREFMDNGLNISINTDNRTVTNTTVKKELQFLDSHSGLSPREAAMLMKQAMETSFAENGIKQQVKKEVEQWEKEYA